MVSATSVERLTEEIEALWKRLNRWKAVDAKAGTFSRQRFGIFEQITRKTVEREELLRLIEAEKRAPVEAEIEEEDRLNDRGRLFPGIVARCPVTGHETHSWGTSWRSRYRSVAVLNEECWCPARKHLDPDPPKRD